jgi:GMP synthase-like glutamine amidotransferase
MRAHYLQHIPFEGLGSIAPWLEASGYEITGTKFFESAKYPNLKEISLLVILGGPMSANDVILKILRCLFFERIHIITVESENN